MPTLSQGSRIPSRGRISPITRVPDFLQVRFPPPCPPTGDTPPPSPPSHPRQGSRCLPPALTPKPGLARRRRRDNGHVLCPLPVTPLPLPPPGSPLGGLQQGERRPLPAPRSRSLLSPALSGLRAEQTSLPEARGLSGPRSLPREE